jgi:acyl-CoA thioesterase-1
MRTFLITILFLCTITVAQASILVLGDSLSAGYGLEDGKDWVSILRQNINQRCSLKPPVINASISGERTENAISKFPPLLSQYHPSLVLIELGGNDALRGSPIQTIKDNLSTLIDMAQHAHAKVLLCEMMIVPNLGPTYASAFHDMYQTLANEKGAVLVPFMLKDVAGHPELMQADIIHPTEEAQPIIFNNVWPTVREAIACHDSQAS